VLSPHRRLILTLAVTACALGLAFCAGKPAESGSSATAPTASGAPSPAPTGATAEAPPGPAAPAADQEPVADDPSLRPEAAAGAIKGVPAPTNTVPIVAVANYFTELAGFDIAALKGRQREKFLQRVNSEMCTCGCKNDTLAHCYVNDPRCPVVKEMVQRVYDEARAGK
jgi:hypothetical protein